MARRAEGAAIPSPYGPISPKIDETTGLPLIKLPDGFRYMTFSWTGDVMSDGVRCPNLHDGMAVVDAEGNSGRLILVRNHEGANGLALTSLQLPTWRRRAAPPTLPTANTVAGKMVMLAARFATAPRPRSGSPARDVRPGHGYASDVGAQAAAPDRYMGRRTKR
jgi:hypothetical protein